MPKYLRTFAISVIVAMPGSVLAYSGGLETAGSLTLGESKLGLCVHGFGGEPEFTIADRRLLHDGNAPVTITDVRLVDAHNMKLIDSVLVPTGHGGMGSRDGWPPGGPHDSIGVPRAWEERVDAIGATIEPGSFWNPAHGIEVTDMPASAAAIEMEYEDSRGNTSVVIAQTELSAKRDCWQ